MFIRLNFAALLEMEIREGRGPRLRAPGAVPALYLLSHTYYMLITTIPKPRLQGVNLVGHYSSLYFRVLCIAGPSWAIGRGVEARMRSCGRRVQSVLSDEGKGGEWQPRWPKNGECYIFVLLFYLLSFTFVYECY